MFEDACDRFHGFEDDTTRFELDSSRPKELACQRTGASTARIIDPCRREMVGRSIVELLEITEVRVESIKLQR